MKIKANILGFCLYNKVLLRENSESIKYAPIHLVYVNQEKSRYFMCSMLLRDRLKTLVLFG